MAAGATIYKANVDISDIDRGYYANHVITLARHPSETEERLAIRFMNLNILAKILKPISMILTF